MSGPLLGLWSVPRARSTAFERMMAERGDVTVVHEPFSQVRSFGTAAVGARACESEEEVMRALQALAGTRPVFFKDTLDKRYPVVLADRDFQRAVTHGFLVRSPEAVVASYLRVDARADRDAMGFENLAELYDAVHASTGQEAFVVDGDHLVADPRRTVEAYCLQMGIPFLESALGWEEGGLPEWGRFERWHETAASTPSFVQTHPEPLPDELRGAASIFAEYHRRFYNRLVSGIAGAPPPRAR